MTDNSRSSEISEWCHLTFTANTMAKAKKNVDGDITTEFQYRAFVAGYDSSLASDTTALRRAMDDMLRGKNPSQNYTVLKDSGTWRYCKNECKKNNPRRDIIALNAVVKQIWKEFGLKFNFKGVKQTGGSDCWQMCPVITQGTAEENHLKYSGNTLDLGSVEKIPFMYLPLSMDTLPMKSYLVVVTQRSQSI